MPVYVYKCRNCKQVFEKKHGMFFEQKRCIHCNAEDIFKIPSIQSAQIQAKGKSVKNKPGQIVDQYIRDAKEDIKQEKKRLTKEEM